MKNTIIGEVARKGEEGYSHHIFIHVLRNTEVEEADYANNTTTRATDIDLGAFCAISNRVC